MSSLLLKYEARKAGVQVVAREGQFRELWIMAAFLQLFWCCSHQPFACGDWIGVHDLILPRDMEMGGEKDFSPFRQ